MGKADLRPFAGICSVFAGQQAGLKAGRGMRGGVGHRLKGILLGPATQAGIRERCPNYANIAVIKATIRLNVMIARVLTLFIMSFPFIIQVIRQANPVSI